MFKLHKKKMMINMMIFFLEMRNDKLMLIYVLSLHILCVQDIRGEMAER